MAPKKKAAGKSGGGGKKAKAPEFATSDEDCLPFGVRVADYVRTPLGLQARVLGVKWEDIQRTVGRVWVQYPSGLVAPLEPRTNLIGLGYKRSSEAEHIWRDLAAIREKVVKQETRHADANNLALEALGLEGAGKQGGTKKQGGAKGGKRPATAK